MDEDIAIPEGEDVVNGEGFVCPVRGHAPSTYWPNNSKLVGDHIAAGLH